MRPAVTRNVGLLLVSGVTILASACGGGKVVVVPNNPPAAPAALVQPAPAGAVVATLPEMPALPVDATMGVSPGANYIWIKGYYNWTGNRYVWVPGTWMQVPRASAVWVPGQWQATSGGYVWVAGHWQ